MLNEGDSNRLKEEVGVTYM